MFVFFFKQKTAYDMRISDWSSDVCSSDLPARRSDVPRRRPGDDPPAGRMVRQRRPDLCRCRRMSVLPTEVLGKSLLSPNATDGERPLEDELRAATDLSAVGDLWNPETCPFALLLFIAWGMVRARWDGAWQEAEKTR